MDLRSTINSAVGKTALDPRPYQYNLITKTLTAYLEKKLRSVMIESPTGSGKTATALCIIKIMQELNPGLAVGWINMRRNLLSQAENENKTKKINANVKFLSMFSKTLPPELMAGHKDAAPLRMLVCDESQHDAAGSMVHIHQQVKADWILGMTATGWRSDHVKLCFDTIVKDAGLGPLIRDGWLSPYHHYTIPRWDVVAICETYLRDPQRWGKTIIYFHRIEECYKALAILTDAGIAADVVTGSTDRVKQLEDFAEGRTTVLLNCMVLTEGFDSPDLKTVFCRPSCKSVTIQMCGRAFRKHPDVPHKQIVQTKKGWPFVKLVMPMTQWIWEDEQWLSLTVNPHIDRLGCKMLAAIATLNVQLPAFIIKAQMSKRGRSKRNKIDGKKHF